MPKLLIGFNGRARSGKSFAAETIDAYLRQWAFPSVGIYDIGSFILKAAIDEGRLPANTKRSTMTPEQLLVLIEMGRDSDRWMCATLKAMADSKVDVGLIPNIRYPGQAATVRAQGGFNVCCTRYNRDGSIYISSDRPANDPGETNMMSYQSDYYISAFDGEPEWMKEQAIVLVDYLIRKVAV